MKHAPVTITLRELINATPDSYVADEVAAELDLGHIVHKHNCCGGTDPECPGFRAYSPEELGSLIEVNWPEHVLTPRFNGDAWYRKG